jgi:uncharacterized protein YqeY
MLIEKIKEDRLQAMRDKDKEKYSLLSVLEGDAKKNNKSPTDSDVIDVVKKLIKSIDETLKIAPCKQLIRERIILTDMLPKQLSKAELVVIVHEWVNWLKENHNPVNTGSIMKHLKDKYNGKFNGKEASLIVKGVLDEVA